MILLELEDEDEEEELATRASGTMIYNPVGDNSPTIERGEKSEHLEPIDGTNSQ